MNDHPPRKPDAAAWLARSREALARADAAEAARALAQAVALAPFDADLRLEHGNCLADLGRLADACAQYRAGIALDPAAPSLHYNLGIALDDQLELDASERAYRSALDLAPGLAEAHVNLALCLLKQGRLAQAWPEYEWRWDPRHPQRNSARLPALARPRWTGQDLSGRTLLLAPEQGHGDTLQFCRYASPLKAMGAHTVIVAHPALAPVLRSARDVERVVALGERFSPDDYDFWTLPLSLPGLLGTTLTTIPATVPYVGADRAKVAAWARRLPSAAARIRPWQRMVPSTPSTTLNLRKAPLRLVT